MDEVIGGAVVVALAVWVISVILVILAYLAVVIGVLALVGFITYWLVRLAREYGDRLLAPGLARLSIRRTFRQLDREVAATMQEITFTSTVLPLSDAEQTLSLFALNDEVEPSDAA